MSALKAVRYRESLPIANAVTESAPEPLHNAGGRGRLRQQRERVHVAEQDPEEQHVAELPAGGAHQGGVVVPDEEDDHAEGDQDPEAGEGGGHEGERGVPPHVLQLEVVAGELVRVRPAPWAAVAAREVVEDVLVLLALDAYPAAGVALRRRRGVSRSFACGRRHLPPAARKVRYGLFLNYSI